MVEGCVICLCVCLGVSVEPFSVPLLCAALNLCEYSMRVEGSYLKATGGCVSSLFLGSGSMGWESRSCSPSSLCLLSVPGLREHGLEEQVLQSEFVLAPGC